MTTPVDIRLVEGTGAASDPGSRCLMDVRLAPHRSLAARNVRLVVVLFSLVATVASVPFVVMGAWPVAGFMGLDVLLITVAFRANIRAARAYEHVVVTPLELLLAKVSARGLRREFRFHPAWVRLNRVEHEEFGIQRLLLRSHGRSVEVAGFLGAEAKAQFAGRLTAALSEARRGPRFS